VSRAGTLLEAERNDNLNMSPLDVLRQSVGNFKETCRFDVSSISKDDSSFKCLVMH
jgi:hypothetical protein